MFSVSARRRGPRESTREGPETMVTVQAAIEVRAIGQRPDRPMKSLYVMFR